MKNPGAHLNLLTPVALLRSVLFHFSPRARRISTSKSYLGLCAYVHALANVHTEAGSKFVFDKEGFLALGTVRSSFMGWAGRTSIHMKKNATLRINGFADIGRGALIWILEGGEIEINGPSFTSGKNMLIAKERITIGRGCAIAWGVTICDHDFHKLYEDGKPRIETAPVEIGENVWIGMNATILKGVKIGSGAVIAAGSVVTRDVPSRALAGGNPAKILKTNIDFRG